MQDRRTGRRRAGHTCSSDRTPPDADTKHASEPSSFSNPSDPEKTESDGRDLLRGVAPHARRSVFGSSEMNSSARIPASSDETL